MKIKILLSSIFLIALQIGCTNKFNMPNENIQTGQYQNISDTLYIQQHPVWNGFNKPEDIIVGREPFIYIADTGNDRIVMMNVAGQILGSIHIKHPTSLAQDYKLNLLVCAQFDTVINSKQLSFSAVYKIDLVAVNHRISEAPIKRILPQSPKIDPFAFSRPDRIYTGIAVFYDNSYFVARKGPSNSNPIDRDNAVLTIREGKITESDGTTKDTLYIGKIPLLAAEGTGLLSANQISSLTASGRNNHDFIMTLIGNNSFKVQSLKYVNTQDFSGYQSKFQPFASDLMKVNKFGKPEGVALDNANNIFVADAQKDSIFKFNSFGDEMESFGGADVFKNPHSVAYYNKTVYVVDTGNNRILRFILSTDID